MKYAILAFVLLLAGCPQAVPAKGIQAINRPCFTPLAYAQDERTFLCFAFCGSGDSFAFANVPCSREVLRLVQDRESPEINR